MRALKDVRYPGRFIAIGKDGGSVAAIYGVTGRSSASQARRYVQKGNTIIVMPTDEAELAKGQRDLLVYPAYVLFEGGLVVANGNQIKNVSVPLIEESPYDALTFDLAGATAESDRYHTPRITGIALGDAAALHAAREDGNRVWEVALESGHGMLISTYTGDAESPVAYTGDPMPVALDYGSADAAARAVYDLLAPPIGAPDFRISVMAVYLHPGAMPDVAIVNRFI